jgi:hypothetical protein
MPDIQIFARYFNNFERGLRPGAGGTPSAWMAAHASCARDGLW